MTIAYRVFAPLVRYAPWASALRGAPRPIAFQNRLVRIHWFVEKSAGYGDYILRGTATRDGVPASRVRVYLISLSDQQIKRITLSGEDGVYRFASLPPDPRGYAVVGFDPLNTFDPEAKTGLQPTPVP